MIHVETTLHPDAQACWNLDTKKQPAVFEPQKSQQRGSVIFVQVAMF